MKKSYRERVKDRMGEYYNEKKPFRKSSKSCKNNMGEAEFISEVNVKNLKLKKLNKPSPPKHLRERKKLIKKKMAKKNSKSILSGTFDFDPEDYLKKLLLFDLKSTSQEKIFDAIIKKLPNTDTYYIEYCDGTNAFCIRKDKEQVEKDSII